MEIRNLYLVHKDKSLYSILAVNEEQAMNLSGQILDEQYIGVEGTSCTFYWEDWDDVEKRLY